MREATSGDLRIRLERHERWVRGSGEDADRLVLAGAALAGVVLEGAVLVRADFSGADLTGADLSRAVLSGADLSGADLSGADLLKADLSDCALPGAVLRGIRGKRLDLSYANLCGADLTDADLLFATLLEADLTDARLCGVAIGDAVFAGTRLHGARCRGLRAVDNARVDSIDVGPPGSPKILTMGEARGWLRHAAASGTERPGGGGSSPVDSGEPAATDSPDVR